MCQAQMQLPGNGFLRPMTWFLGETWAPAVWFAYLSRCLSEGDAVTVETALSPGARARTADFLNYYQVALDQGDTRNWYRWRYGSYKHYTPDFYKLGYVTVAGARYLYDDPLLMGKALQESRRYPWMLSTANLKKVVREHSGKPFKASFQDILGAYQEVWSADAAARGQLTPLEQVTPEASFPVEYSSPAVLGGRVYLLRQGYLQTPQLGYLDDFDRFRAIRPFASHTSALFPCEPLGRLYWSETVPSPRWSLSGKSIIRYYDSVSGKVADITRTGRLYNPHPSPEGRRLSAVEYPFSGGSAVVVLDAISGAELRRTPAPDGVQAVEAAWLGETLYVTGISWEGYGLYTLSPEGVWGTELAPGIQKMVRLSSGDGFLEWVSDRDGTNALYRYSPATGELVQRSVTRYGATDFCTAGDQVYAVGQTLGGRMLFKAPEAALVQRPVRFSDTHTYKIEDAITRQEGSLGDLWSREPVEMSSPRRYYKFPHLMRFHSWAPAYVNYDAVQTGSFDFSFKNASPGLSAYFQNTLSTMSGMVGYAFHPSDADPAQWRHTLHARFTYSGWYPVIEASVDFNDAEASQYNQVVLVRDDLAAIQLLSRGRNLPQLVGTVRTYLPLSWHKGGVASGLVPQLSYSLSNNVFDNGLFLLDYPLQLPGAGAVFEPRAAQPARLTYLRRASASVRGYVMLPRARSQVYPRWGIGMEAGASVRPGMELYAPNVYAYLYAYTPGFFRTQGLRLTATWQEQLRRGWLPFQWGENTANTLPRGFSSPATVNIPRLYARQFKFTADYAVPIYVGDLALPPVLYIRNFLLTPHADLTVLTAADNLWSVGADLTAQLGKILMIPFDGSLGVSVSYLGGSAYAASGQTKPWSVRLVMSFDFK